MDISSASRVHKNEWTKSGIRFFRSSDVVASFNKKKNTEAFISHELYEKLSSKSGKVCQGDILITGGGSIGIPYLIKDEEPLYFKDADLIWLKNSGKLNGYFLFTYFVTNGFRQYLESISHIGTISHYTIEQAKVTPISLPNKNEQDKIGVFFDKLDNTIALHQDAIQRQQVLKKALLQKLFPVNGEQFPTVRFATFKEEWEQRKLGDTVRITMGQSPSGENYTENPKDHILVQGNADMKNGRVVPRVWTTQVTKNADPDDIILSVRAPVGDVGKTDYPVVLGRGVAGISGNAFIFQTLSRMKETGFWTRYSSGSTFESVNSSDLKDAVISIPNIEEQTKIGDFFTKLDGAIALHQQALDKLKLLKQSLLQKMFV